MHRIQNQSLTSGPRWSAATAANPSDLLYNARIFFAKTESINCTAIKSLFDLGATMVNGSALQFNFKSFANGVYLYKVVNEKNEAVKQDKIIIKH